MSPLDKMKAKPTMAAEHGISQKAGAGPDEGVSQGIFYVLLGLLFLPLGIAYGCYLLYRFLQEHL